MNIKNFIQKQLRRWRNEPELSEQALIRLLSSLEHTHDEELSCDEVFALVDEYAEASQRGEDVAHLKPLLRRHLELCRECEEEYQALLQVLEGTAS
ncbi:MAG: hypothetical protein ACOYYU_19795 [Chloroflexota bacterium]